MMIVCFAPYNIANVPYLYSYGLNEYYHVKSYLLIPSHESSVGERTLYGYKHMGNPYGVPILYYRGVGDGWRSLFRALARLAREGLDILHLFGGGRWWHALYAKLVRAKIVRHFVGSDLRRAYTQTSRKVLFRILSEQGIILGWHAFEYLVWDKAREKALFVPITVDPIFYEVPNEKENQKIIFMPTRHDPGKRTPMAFEAWRILSKLDKEVKLVTISWGENYDSLRGIYSRDPRIEWLPVLPRREYLKVLERSSLVWGQFCGEMGTIETEAMAARRPVLAYVSKNFSKAHKNPPIISAPDPHRLALETKALLDDRKRRKSITRKAFKWVKEERDIKKVTTLLYDYYTKILG